MERRERWVFHAKKGIRQGNPLPLYLFVLSINKLSHMILDSIENNKWDYMKIGRGVPRVSHLMFAYDLILFGATTKKQNDIMLKIIEKFCHMSGQGVSMEKLNIKFSRNTSQTTRRIILHKTDFKETEILKLFIDLKLLTTNVR